MWENELKTNLLGEEIRILHICMILPPTNKTQNRTSTGKRDIKNIKENGTHTYQNSRLRQKGSKNENNFLNA